MQKKQYFCTRKGDVLEKCAKFEMEKKTRYKWRIGIGFVLALIYVLVPVDFLPDVTPAVGWIDDIIAVLLALANALAVLSKIKKS